MSAPPYMKMYIADYLGDTHHLTALEHGAYLLLLMGMWRAGGSLPASDDNLAKLARCTAPEWAAVKGSVLPFFIRSRARLTHKRIAREMAKYDAISDARSEAGKRGAAKTNNKNNEQKTAIADRLPTKPEPEPEPERKREIAKAISCPNGFETFWNSYPRKASKLASAKAYAKALARIGGPDPQAFLLAALEVARHGWTDERFTPHASTWLNGERYNDAPPSNIVSLPHERLDGPAEKHAARISNLSEGVGVAHEIAAYRGRLAGGGG